MSFSRYMFHIIMHQCWNVWVCFTAICNIAKMECMTCSPCSLGGFCLASSLVGRSLSMDLYMPRCQPDGDVVVLSGHFLNPAINSLNVRGRCVSSFGSRRLCWCSRSRRVVGSISRFWGMLPWKTWLPNSVSPLYCSRLCRGVCIYSVPFAWLKCHWALCSRSLASMVPWSVLGCQVSL